jgi:phage-related protein
MATPAAVRAGQTFEQLAGMMAFLTRNGLSASSASASAGRALENLANPTVVKNLEAIGVTVKDAHGEFLPMVDVVDQLAKVFADMTGPEKAAALQDLLKGAGNNVQARRFWNLATENADGLRSFTESMFGASGQMDKAYDIMFNQPQSQIQLLTNQYEILKTEVGDQLLPVKLKLAEAALKVLEAWNGLSEGTQNLIIKIAAFTSAFLLVFGIVLTVVGVFGMLIAAIAPLVGGIGAAILVITGIGAAIVALGVVIFLIIRNFDTLKEVASDVWHFIREQALKAWHMMQDFWDWLSSAGVDVWHAISSAAKTAWDALTDAWDDVVGAFKKGWGWLSRTLGPGISAVMDVVSKDVIPVFEEIGETLGAFFKYTKQGFELWWIGVKTAFKVVVDTITQLLVPSIQFMIYWFSLGFNVVVEVVKFAITFIRAYIEFGVGVIVAIWQNFGSIIWNVIKNAWAQVWNYIKTVISIISNMLQFFMNVFQGDWGEAWQNVKNILSAAWNGIKTAVKLAIDLLLIMVRDLPGKILSFLGDVGRLLWQKGKDVISGLWTGMQNVWDILLGWVRGLPGKITGLFNSAVSWLFSVGKDILQGLWDGMKAIWRDITGWFQGLADHLPGWIKGPLGMNSPSKVFIELGKNTMEGYRIGLERSWRDVEKLMGGMGSSLQSDFNVNGSMSASTSGYRPDDRPPSDGRGMYVAGDLVVREERVASDMDWWARTGTTGV